MKPQLRSEVSIEKKRDQATVAPRAVLGREARRTMARATGGEVPST